MKKQIGQLLIEHGVISKSQLDLALKIQARDNSGPVGIILVMLDYISPEQLLKCLDRQRLHLRKAMLED